MIARTRLTRVAAVALVSTLAGSVGLAAPALAGKQGKHGKRGSLKTRTLISGPVNLPIPDDPDGSSGAGAGVLQSQIAAGKKLKGLSIDDVNVGMRVSHGEVSDLRARITAPNGATVYLILGSTGGPSWGTGAGCGGGFLTIDDESSLHVTAEANPVVGYDLAAPYVGSSVPPTKPLSTLDGGPVRGAWTLTLIDRDTPGQVGTLDCWQLQVTPRR